MLHCVSYSTNMGDTIMTQPNPKCLICQGGNIGMNPLALGELRSWHDAGHPTQVSDMLSYSFKSPQQPSNAPKSPSATTKSLEEILKVAYNYGRLYGILNKQGEHTLNGLSAAINNLINQRVIEELERLPIFYEYTENEDRIDSQATIYIRNRIESLKGGIDE